VSCGESEVFGFDTGYFFDFSSDFCVVIVQEDSYVEIDYCDFEVSVSDVERCGVERHVDAFCALVSCGSPACVGNTYGWSYVCASGAGCEHFDWVPLMMKIVMSLDRGIYHSVSVCGWLRSIDFEQLVALGTISHMKAYGITVGVSN
jgi:hypothetical protein